VLNVRLLQREATRLLCECGHSICCAVRQEGERLGFLVFFDDQEASKTYAEQVASRTACDLLGSTTTHCSKQLGE
jgi:hypothetical protein